jgi:hypothetical protein
MTDDLRTEYQLDYSKATPNRFVSRVEPGGRIIVLDPDVAEVFIDSNAVNDTLRTLIRKQQSTISETAQPASP